MTIKYSKYIIWGLLLFIVIITSLYFKFKEIPKKFECKDNTKFLKVSKFEYERDKDYLIVSCKSFIETQTNSSWFWVARFKDSIAPIVYVDTISYSPDKLKFISIVLVKCFARGNTYRFNTRKSQVEYVSTEEGYDYVNFVFIGVRDSMNLPWDVYDVGNMFGGFPPSTSYDTYYEASQFYRNLFYEEMYRAKIPTRYKIDGFKDYETVVSPISVGYVIGHNVHTPCFWKSIIWSKELNGKEKNEYYRFQLGGITNTPEKLLLADKRLITVVYSDTLLRKFKTPVVVVE